MKTVHWLTVLALALGSAALQVRAEKEQEWNDFFEPEFPFHCTTFDARGEEPGSLTPRGIILHVGAGYHVCFDPDLLRIAALWKEDDEGEFLTRVGMAPGSYPRNFAGKKAPGGQAQLPQLLGEVILTNGTYPGWVEEGTLEPWVDPRIKSVDKAETGLGPLQVPGFRFEALEVTGTSQVKLHYVAGGVPVVEWFEVREGEGGGSTLMRIVELKQPAKGLSVVWKHGELRALSGTGEHVFPVVEVRAGPPAGSVAKGNDTVRVEGSDRLHEGAYEIHALKSPTENPWNRNVRLSGLDFFADGRGVFTTFDGDVWLADGLDGEAQIWRRFARGLNEPMGVQVVDEEIYVFDRTAIWKLLDTTGDGQADRYENFSGVVAQTAETREFPTGFVKRPGGGFVLSKGGQVGTTRGLYNGTVIAVSSDGQDYEVLGRGLRMPFIGVDPRTGVVTSSDQQGHWVPATPIHRIEGGRHYGFLPTILRDAKHTEPIAEPMLWIPHFTNQSGASQITNYDPRFGPLAGRLLLLGYNRPEMHCVFPDGDQGGVASLWDRFDGGLLKAAVNPKDGQIYLCGFKIWGTVGEKTTALFRLRYTGAQPLEVLKEVRSERRGILLRFHTPVSEALASSLGSYEVDRWNYLRSSQYGSGNYRLDGKPGQETMPVSSVYLAQDRKAVFLGVPGMKPVEQMRVTYRHPYPPRVSTPPPVSSEEGETVGVPLIFPEIRAAYVTVKELRDLDLRDYGFGDIQVDLALPEGSGEKAEAVASVEAGRQLSTTFGCVACHSLDGSKSEKVGPTWLNLYGSKRTFTDGTHVKVADDVYLRESILNPSRRVTVAFDGEGVGMPPYLGVLKDHQVDSLILFIKSLAKKK